MKEQNSLTVLGCMVMTKFAKKFVTELSQFCLHGLNYTSYRTNMHVHGEPVVLKNPSKCN